MKTTRVGFQLLFGALLLFVQESMAQNLSASIGGGYHLGVGKQNLTHHDFSSFLNSNPWPWEKFDVSLGEGAMVDANVQYMFGNNLGVDLSASYLFGVQHTSRVPKNDTEYIRQLQVRMLRLSPGFIFSVDKKKLSMYARFGMVIGIGYIDYNQENYYNNALQQLSYRYVEGVSLGASSSLGVSYPIGSQLSLYTEFRFVSQSYAPKRGVPTKYVSQGVESQNTLEYEFVDELEQDPTIVVNPDEPLKQPKYSYPVNGYGINLGIKYRIWSKKTND